jgi:hypothetical protein
MTLCETTFRLQVAALSERQLSALEQLKGQVYGMRGFRIAEDLGELAVMYDASRLTQADVAQELHKAGVPVCT